MMDEMTKVRNAFRFLRNRETIFDKSVVDLTRKLVYSEGESSATSTSERKSDDIEEENDDDEEKEEERIERHIHPYDVPSQWQIDEAAKTEEEEEGTTSFEDTPTTHET